MHKFKKLFPCLTLFSSLSVFAEDADYATLSVSPKQWLVKSSAMTSPVIYHLDVYATTEKKVPEIVMRSPNGSKHPRDSEHYIGSLKLSGKHGEATEFEIPKGKFVYLSSYLYQKVGLVVRAQTKYCHALDTLTPTEDKYILDVNFISKGLMSGDCRTAIYTAEDYALSFSNIRESTAIDGLSRKELSLRFGSLTTVRLIAAVISQTNDYLPVYLNAALDRLNQEANIQEKSDAIAWLCKLISQSGSEAHIAAMKLIGENSDSKKTAKTISKYLPKHSADAIAYVPQTINAIAPYSLIELAEIAAVENLKSQTKSEIEAGAREIIIHPDKYEEKIYQLAEQRLFELSETKGNESEAASIWMLRVLQASGNKAYIPSVQRAADKATHRKVKAAAEKAIEVLSQQG